MLMRSRSEHEQSDPIRTDSYRELRLLAEVENNSEVTQRQLSTRLGIALGLTNVLLRNLAQKGYLRASQAGWKRWVYAITPDGFSHKLRLTLGYISRVLDHYQTVRQTLRDQIKPLAMNEETRVAMFGTGEFAELIYLGLKDIGVEEIDFFDSGDTTDQLFLGKRVRDISTLETDAYDHVVVAFLDNSKANVNEIKGLNAAPEKLVTFFVDAPTGANK